MLNQQEKNIVKNVVFEEIEALKSEGLDQYNIIFDLQTSAPLRSEILVRIIMNQHNLDRNTASYILRNPEILGDFLPNTKYEEVNEYINVLIENPQSEFGRRKRR